MRTVLLFVIAALGLASCIKDRVPEPKPSTPPVVVGSRKLVHYWTFNGATLIAPDTTIGGAAITVGGTSDAVTPGTSLNTRRDTASGAALRVRNPSTTMTLQLPTTGYKQPILSFAAMRTSNGPQQNDLSYTLDGTNYINAGITPATITIGVAWTVFSVDFSAISGADNNPDFAVRLTLSNGNTGASGNDRYDNIAVHAFKR